jgi:hypothetical protein
VSLADNLILLVVTAGLTGVLVPALKGILDYMKEQRQRKIARQREVLESQAKLLERLAELLWRYWKLALEVAYYGKQTSEWDGNIIRTRERNTTANCRGKLEGISTLK